MTQHQQQRHRHYHATISTSNNYFCIHHSLPDQYYHNMSKPRPGVEAAKRLSKSTDVKLWQLVESQYDTEIIHQINNFNEVDGSYQNLRDRLQDDSKTYITKEELLTVVKWKFMVGKPRHALMKHLQANSETSIKEQSTIAIREAKDKNIKVAIETLADLKGVGPATASAVLSLVAPDAFCYMYDEVIETFLPKRNYTLSTYLSTNDHCIEVASKLGNGWTPCRVAKVLWAAARVNAYGLCDHTQQKSGWRKENIVDEAEEESSPKKRRRKL